MERDARPLEGGVESVLPSAWAVRAVRRIDRIMRGLEKLAMWLSALSIALMAFTTCLEVFLRSALGLSILISSELASYLLVSCTMLGLAWTLRDGGFIRVDILYARFRGRFLHFANFLIGLVGIVTTAVLTYYLIVFTLESFQSGATSIDVARTPLWIPQLSMPIGAALLFWATLCFAARAGVLVLYPDLASAEEQGVHASEAEGWL